MKRKHQTCPAAVAWPQQKHICQSVLTPASSFPWAGLPLRISVLLPFFCYYFAERGVPIDSRPLNSSDLLMATICRLCKRVPSNSQQMNKDVCEHLFRDLPLSIFKKLLKKFKCHLDDINSFDPIRYSCIHGLTQIVIFNNIAMAV